MTEHKRKGFDLAGVLAEAADVSKLDTGREQIEYIALDRLKADPNNFYSVENIDELAGNIELVGLQQPLRVRPDPDDPENYIIISGHRRWTALKLLAEEGKANLAPCIVEREAKSPALQELKLIYANASTRELMPVELAKQAERVEALLYQLKEEGMEFPGRMRDYVAQACNTTASKLGRLKVIREKLVEPRWVGEWELGVLPEKSAYVLAQMPPILQAAVAEVCVGKPTPIAFKLEHVQRAGMDHYLTVASTCPETKEGCVNGKGFLAADLDPTFWVGKCAGKCCLGCYNYTQCKHVCGKAKKKAKARKAKERAERKAEQDAEAACRKRVDTFNRAVGKRLAAACGDDEAAFKKMAADIDKKLYHDSSSSLRYVFNAYAFGDDSPYRSINIPLAALAELCRRLDISADWLLGLKDN